MPKKSVAQKQLTGLFVIDIQSLKLSQEKLEIIDVALQETMQKEIAKIDDTESVKGGPLGGGIAGYRVVDI